MLTYELVRVGYSDPSTYTERGELYAHNLLVLRSACEYPPLDVLNRWLDLHGVLYHYEMVNHQRTYPTVYAGGLDVFFVIHVYDESLDMEIRLATDRLPLARGWRKRFVVDGEITSQTINVV